MQYLIQPHIPGRVDKFIYQLKESLFDKVCKFEIKVARSKDPVEFSQRQKLKYSDMGEGETWGKNYSNAWFHLKAKIPSGWNRERIWAHLNFGSEALIFSNAGAPVQGLCQGSVFDASFDRNLLKLDARTMRGRHIEFWVEAAANHLFGLDQKPDPKPEDADRHGSFAGTLKFANFGLFNEEVWGLWMDMETLRGLARSLPADEVRVARCWKALGDAVDVYLDDVKNAAAARKVLAGVLNSGAAGSDLQTLAVGHAHIDTGWLWPVSESVRKCARTFATQVEMIDRYPGYVFGASQPQHYAFVKEHYPKLYKEMQKRHRAGTWELQGGMWVEADCNIISGESMVRQVLHGKNFYRDEFGEDVQNLWLPDVFGYSAAMPQIMKKTGIKYFLTQKISWSQFNKFPHHTFWWEGIDGTKILTHFPPEDTYNSQLNPEGLVKARRNFREKHVLDEFMTLFGMGDGGAGPKELHLELGMRQKNLEGAPRVIFGHAKDFFNRLEKRAGQLDVWSGELYLELHRGTLTTQAAVKWWNRKLERKIRGVEFLGCCVLKHYPLNELDQIWKKVLINQFHDILPGSSVKKVYENTHAEYRECDATLNALEKKLADRLLKKSSDQVVLMNILENPYRRPIELPATWGEFDLMTADGREVQTQMIDGKCFVRVDLPAHSFTELKRKPRREGAKSTKGQKRVLENDRIRYEFSDSGELVRATGKEGKEGMEFLRRGQVGNRLSLYIDRPANYDAWDVDIFYKNQESEKAVLKKCEPCGVGPAGSALKLEFAIGSSRIEQLVTLAAGSRALEFQTRVEWNEKHKLLKVRFEGDVVAKEASFDIQYGFIKRATHTNTSWDVAKFEVPAHRYVDLSDSDKGFALINDCKYGHHVGDNFLEISLLRSPTYPDPDADMGSHQWTYAYVPHSGGLIGSEVMDCAEQLNQGVQVFAGHALGKANFPVQLTGSGLSLAVVKKAEKENAIILRISENHGRRSNGKLSLKFPHQMCCETDMMEWNDGKKFKTTNDIALSLKPFEIKTLKVFV